MSEQDTFKYFNTFDRNNYEWFEIIYNMYRKNDKYHSVHHVFSLLDRLEPLKKCVRNIEMIQAAIWFHDIIYDPKRNDNEEKSKQVFQYYAGTRFSSYFIDNVGMFIMCTKDHKLPEKDLDPHLLQDLKIFLDLDMSIFDTESKEYSLYAYNIRREYEKTVPNYEEMRIKFLNSVLEKSNIFYTVYFKDEKARENINWEIDLLKSHLPKTEQN